MRRAIAAAAAAAALLAGCGGGEETAAAEDPCGSVERPDLQGGGHLVGDATPPIPYSSTPGTSGYHAPGAPRTGVFTTDDPLTEPQLVLALEVGQVVAAYDPQGLPGDDIDRLADLARDRFAGELTVTPFDGDTDAPLVLNAWGVRQPCTELSEDAVAAFVGEFGRAAEDDHA